ncbi:hypothetical protein B7463_g11983, partial [Scytalidium lignicola]
MYNNLQATQIATQVLALVIPGMALANNFDGFLGALAFTLTPALALGPSGPRCVTPALIGLVIGLTILALTPTLTPAPALAGLFLAERLYNLTKTF